MGHGNGIKWYQQIQLPGTGIEAATTCLAVDPARPPGSPDEFYAAATRLGRRAQALRDVLDKLRRIDATEGVWTGDAADAFRSVLRDAHRAHYDQVPTRYDGYARALRQYATTLSGHQSAIDGARADVQAALDAYHRAQTSAPPMKPGLSTCPPSYLHPTDLLPPSPACGAVIDDCLTAARRFQVAYNDWIDAVTTCEHAIERVDGDKLHDPHGGAAVSHALDVGLHTFVDLTAELAGVVSALSAVLTVLTLPWPPAAAFFLLVSTVASGVQLLADLDRRFQYYEKVTGPDLAFDALGSIPLGKPSAEAARVGKASRAAGLLGRLRAGGAKFGKTLGGELKGFPSDIKQTLSELKKFRWRPDLGKVGPTVKRIGPTQDVVVTGAQAGTQAYDHRKGGLRSVDRAAIDVVLGPAGPLVDIPLNAMLNNLRGLPRLAHPGGGH